MNANKREFVDPENIGVNSCPFAVQKSDEVIRLTGKQSMMSGDTSTTQEPSL